MKKGTFLVFVALLALASSASYFYIQNDSAKMLTQSAQQIVSDSLPKPKLAPSPIPFEELTIPYLQKQTYDSSLAQLVQVKNTSTHLGYTTSYLSDGLKVNGYLAVPKGEAPAGGFPAVVLVHGYIPPQNYQTLSNYISFADALAAEGIVVFKIDLRGHGDSEGSAEGAYFSGDYVVDTLNAYDALQKAEFVNPNKVGLWGHSMAGNVLLRSMTVEPSIPKVVIWAGAVYSYQDMIDYGIQDSSYRPPTADSERQSRRDTLFDTHSRFNQESDFWETVAATNYTQDIEGEIQLHHAVNDTVVSIEYSRNLSQLLDETQVPHQLYEYNSGGHNLTGSTFNQAIQRTANFLSTY